VKKQAQSRSEGLNEMKKVKGISGNPGGGGDQETPSTFNHLAIGKPPEKTGSPGGDTEGGLLYEREGEGNVQREKGKVFVQRIRNATCRV